MIYRRYFVANSSSSSYVCNVCGDSGSDDDYAVECNNYIHTFCPSCALEMYGINAYDGDNLTLSDGVCKCCNLETLSTDTLNLVKNALLKNIDLDTEDLRRMFGNEKELRANIAKIIPLDGRDIKFGTDKQTKETKHTNRRLNLRG